MMVSAAASAEIFAWRAPPHTEVNEQQFASWLKAREAKQTTLESLLSAAGSEGSASPYLNRLILENSPYLLRHATNPVNWQPWEPSVFSTAQQEGKLVFLSIGYSTCHWCHVMEKESFVNEDVARLLNRSYLSVKVDREQLPDVDAYYSQALEAVAGSSGWPVTAILDGEGNILFISSYIAQQKLLLLLGRLSTLWQTKPAALKRNAATIAQLIASQAPPVVTAEWRDDLLDETEKTLLGLLDPQYGGFAGAQKFPAEASLLFMLQRLETLPTTDSNPALTESLKKQLTAMAQGGLYDHLYGGFHRYATDSHWQVPHYEKMLYNQAQLMIVYSRAYALFGDPLYRYVVEDIAAFLRSWMYQEGAGFYSAIDADYEGHEGHYYLWQPQQLERLLPESTAGVGHYDFEQGERVGLLFTQPQSEHTATIRNTLRKARAAMPRPHIDKKIITAWNALMVWALAEAAVATGDGALGEWALSSVEQLWSEHFDEASGQLLRSRYLGEGGGVGQLDDYAYLAMAYIKIYDLSGDAQWLRQAERLLQITVDRFMDEDGGFYLSAQGSSEKVSSQMRIKIQRDGELLPAGAVMVGVIEALHQRTGKRQYRLLLKQTEGYLKGRFVAAGIDNLYGGAVLTQRLLGSVATQQYFAAGKGRIAVSDNGEGCDETRRLNVNLHLEPGWHINSSQPLQDFLKPTKIDVEGGAVASVNYPKGELQTLGFQQQALSLYYGDFTIEMQLPSPQAPLIVAQLQACNDEVCLLPETLRLRLPHCAVVP